MVVDSGVSFTNGTYHEADTGNVVVMYVAFIHMNIVVSNNGWICIFTSTR